MGIAELQGRWADIYYIIMVILNVPTVILGRIDMLMSLTVLSNTNPILQFQSFGEPLWNLSLQHLHSHWTNTFQPHQIR